MDQSVMVFAGTAARASAIPSPSAGMVAYSTATQLQVYNGTAWVDASTGYGSATGGSATSITVAGTAYTLLDFTSDSTLTVNKSGLFDVLMVGGGGCGGHSLSLPYAGGGGGGGQVLQTTIYLTANQSVTVGAGGSGVNNGVSSSNQGTASKIGAFAVACSGGSGAAINNPNSNGAGAGGNGGGGNGDNFSGFANKGLTIAGGFDAGVGSTSGGGGGGAAAVGSAGSGSTGGAGGAGTQLSTFTGSTITTFVGAGGGGAGTTTGGAAGSTGAGVGASAAGSGTAATANTGSGGGGSIVGAGGNGGSGRVLIRFKS